MTDPLYHWPAAARFGRRVPKEKFYQAGTVTSAVREKFIGVVQSITWTHKLAEATINLPGSPAVPEVQIFQISSKGDDVSEPILIAIDKAIPFPIIYEVSRFDGSNQQVRMLAAHKQLRAGIPKLSAYHSTDWQPADSERQPLPTAITLPALYVALLSPFTPIATRPGETVEEVVGRLQAVGKLERDIAALSRKLRIEQQFNRKVELLRILKVKQSELAQKTR